jgi:hypothetical protein
MAGLNIGAPARLQRGGRALLPAGASTPLGGGSGELPHTYSGSSARMDYWRRLELNTQDSDEDVLFRQEMNYPERGAGGFSGLRRAGAGENRASPPVQQLDVSEYVTASEAGSERGRRRHRGCPEDRPSIGREDAGRSFDQEDREPAGCREEDPDPPANAGHHPGGGLTTHATAAQCKRATASQGTAGYTASQTRREHATAQAGPLRLSSERLRRILVEATSGRLPGGAS